MPRHFLMLILVSLICACGASDEDRRSAGNDEPDTEAASEAPSDGPKTGYGQALQRAKDVERQAEDAAEKRAQEIEKLQEGGGEP